MTFNRLLFKLSRAYRASCVIRTVNGYGRPKVRLVLVPKPTGKNLRFAA